MTLRMEGIDGYDWRDPEITAHWANVRNEIAAKQMPDHHEYRHEATSEHAHFLAQKYQLEMERWQRIAVASITL